MTFKDKIMIYIYRKLNELEEEKRALIEHRRFATMDSLDMYELMRSDIRNEAFHEFINDLFAIIKYLK